MTLTVLHLTSDFLSGPAPADRSPEFGAVFDSVFEPVLVAIGVKSPVESIPRVETLAALLGVE